MFKSAKRYSRIESDFNSRDIITAFEMKGWCLYESDAGQNDLWYSLSAGPADNLSPSDESWKYYRIMPLIKKRNNALKIIIAYDYLAINSWLPRLQISGVDGWRNPLVIPARHIQFLQDKAVFFSSIDVPRSAFKVSYLHFIPYFLQNFYPDLRRLIQRPYRNN